MVKKIISRDTALKIIYKTIEKQGYSNILLDNSLSSGHFSPEDRAFITMLVYGVLENKIYLDWVIDRYSRTKSGNISPWIMNVLRISIYQVFFMDRVPDFAAVNEGVELAKKYGGKRAAGFVNGILRSIIRDPGKAEVKTGGREPGRYLSLKYSYPLWMVEDWIRHFGQDFTEALCKSGNNPPETVIRANTLKVTAGQLAGLLQKEGIQAKRGRYSPVALVLDKGAGIDRLKAYREGLLYVQDESSMLCVEVLDPEPGQFLVDVCSAPGGKTTYAAEIMEDKGRIVARDISRKKLAMVEENYRRLGIKSIETAVYDAEKLDPSLIGRADRVLVDAPCSGLGIIRRKPDIKWKKEREHYSVLAGKQKKILHNASKYLKPGGMMVYSTCTVMPEENHEVFLDFLQNNPEFAPCDITGLVSPALKSDSCKKGFIQLFPNIHGTDGFFIGKMVRKG